MRLTCLLVLAFSSVAVFSLAKGEQTLRLAGRHIDVADNNVTDEGRVEILHEGEWGTICDDFWDLNAANVACRQLGFAIAIRKSSNAEFGQGMGPIWLDNVQCTGEEANISDCSHNGWGEHNCGHSEDAGVVCSHFLPNVTIRLVGGANSTEGRVEISYNGEWGTICDDFWDLNDAKVVCRQLGFSTALGAPKQAFFGAGDENLRIWMDNVHCKGTENSIDDCNHNGWSEHNCRHNEDASVMCAEFPPDVEIRLAGGKNPSEGRVEIFYNERWGTVCDDDWDNFAAQVVCRQAGYLYVLRSTLEFGAGNGTIWLDNVGCTGNESSILECNHGGLGQHNCVHSEDIGVVCSNTTETVAKFTLQLVGGEDNSLGRVEVYYREEWGTICNDEFDMKDGLIICRSLGFKNILRLPHWSEFGRGYGPIWVDQLNCSGNESRIEDCPANEWGIHDCTHFEDVAVHCTNATLNDSYFEIRLAGENSTASEGRVEVRYGGLWGTVCDDFWDYQDAQVVCHQLGFPYAVAAVSSSIFRPGEGPIWMDNVECNGTESHIGECQRSSLDTINCVHSEDAGVLCSNTPVDVPVRLVGGPSPNEGRVEVFFHGEWGTVCNDEWDLLDAAVVCRQLGYSEPEHVVVNYSPGSGKIWFDNVQCTGDEPALFQCPTGTSIGAHNCLHSEDVSVKCRVPTPSLSPTSTSSSYPSSRSVLIATSTSVSPTVSSSSMQLTPMPTSSAAPSQFDVRLVGGSNDMEGRVEIFYNNEWGTVCDDVWDLKDATVVCRQLGHPVAIRRTQHASFGEGSGQIWLDNVACAGNESKLSECFKNDWGQNDCSHSEDAGVVCGAEVPVVQLRLRGGSNESEGRVEVRYNGQWGTICDDFWDMNDATVVCKQLGYLMAIRKSTRAEFGRGEGPIWLDNVDCSGNEQSLIQCSHNGWGDHNCLHSEDAGAVCTNKIPDVAVRLVGGNDTEGRVEIAFNGEWGTVCDDGWDINAAKVICRMLGHSYAIAATTRAHFGQGSGITWLDDVACTGSESRIDECNHDGWGEHNCDHTEDAGVICSSEQPLITLRLAGGASNMEGRLEVLYNGQWGTVCGNDWDKRDAQVACRQLGFNFFVRSTSAVEFGVGNGTIMMSSLGCNGSESNLLDCDHGGLGFTTCVHTNDVGLVCSNIPVSCNEGELRLVSGLSASSGRVEICHDNEWGTVCDDRWDIHDVEVVCRQLGFDYALAVGGTRVFGRGFDKVWLDDVNCTGRESKLADCMHPGWNTHNCNHFEDAGVFCSDTPPADLRVRLVNGTSAGEGRVEVLYGEVWGTVCNDGWSHKDAEVVCRQLNYSTTLGTTSYVVFGSGQGVIWMDEVNCAGNETALGDCQHAGFGNHNCIHAEDVGVICEGEIPPIKLVDGPTVNTGRLEVFFRGEWGTVCDDDWDLKDAAVVCRQLGYSGTNEIPTLSPGSGKIWFDNMHCNGDEEALIFCPHNGFAVHNCLHGEDVAVNCSGSSPPQEFDVRLIDGSNKTEGRVEIFYNNEWGTVCDDLWDLKDATVVCRQLGYPVAIRPSTRAEFGRGSGPIHLDNVNCQGDETMLHLCTANEWGFSDCTHSEDAGVVCSNTVPRVSIRLSGGDNDSEGRVEIYYGGSWGTVCDDQWDILDARVVCRQLGYAAAIDAPRNAAYGQGSGPTWLDDVECKGNENSISECHHGGWGVENCRHAEDASVVCADTVPNITMRLVGGRNPSEGRVEMLYNEKWGTICDDDWNNFAAQVVCRQVGYLYVLRSTLEFGAGNGTIWLDNVGCSGNESSILECNHGGLGQHNCAHSEDIGVVCSNVPDSGTEGELRVRGGSENRSGRLEIYHSGRWGSICNDNWDINDSIVACRQLGFRFGLLSGGVSDFGRSYGPIWLENMNCTGNETSLLNCQHSDWGVHDCHNIEDVGVYCTNTTPGTNVTFRLRGGNSPTEGRVEVQYGGWWGTVCDDGWDQTNTEVLCRQLKFKYAVATLHTSLIGPGEGPVWLDDVSCIGNETSIANCAHDDWGDDNCAHSEDVAVWCANSPVTAGVRLVGGLDQYEGRVEVSIRGEWGTICDDSWDQFDAAVVCNQLGFPGVDAVYSGRSSRFGPGTGRIWLDNLACNGTETNLLQCPMPFALGVNDCTHTEDAGLRCNRVEPSSTRLPNSPMATTSATTKFTSLPFKSSPSMTTTSATAKSSSLPFKSSPSMTTTSATAKSSSLPFKSSPSMTTTSATAKSSSLPFKSSPSMTTTSATAKSSSLPFKSSPSMTTTSATAKSSSLPFKSSIPVASSSADLTSPPGTTSSPAGGSSAAAPIIITLLAIVVIVVLVVLVIMLGLWVRRLQRRLVSVAKMSQNTELNTSSGKYAKFDNEVEEEAGESSV